MAVSHPILTFNAERHEYALADGRLVPSVTTILREVGVSLDFEELGGMSATLADQIEAKRNLGTVVHQDLHALDDDDLVWETVSNESRPYVEAWQTFKDNTGLRPIERERILFHGPQFYCGTTDGVFLDPRDRLVMVDTKLGDPESAAARYQLAGYVAAYQFEHPGVYIAERWSVQLVPGRTVPYNVTAYSDWTDQATFAAFVITFHHQRRRAPRS